MGGRVPGSLGGQLQYKPTGFMLDSDPGVRLAFVFFSKVLKGILPFVLLLPDHRRSGVSASCVRIRLRTIR